MCSKNQCAFLTNIYFVEFTTWKEVAEFNERHGITKGVGASRWRTMRKSKKREMLLYTYYKGDSKICMAQFHEYFSKKKFECLTAAERSAHRYKNCQECLDKHLAYYVLKRSNRSADTPNRPITINTSSIETILVKEPHTITQQDVANVVKDLQPVSEAINQSNHTTYFYTGLLGKRKVNEVGKVSKHAKRRIIRAANQEISEEAKQKDFVALYSSKQSQAEWNRQRTDSYGVQRKTKAKSHTCSLDSVTLKMDIFHERLRQGTSDVNWSKLSREVELKNRYGKSIINCGQVLKELAKSMGYPVVFNSKKRTSWLNYKGHRLNVKKRTSSTVLRELKKEFIASGKLDVGEPIVPIEYDVIKVLDNGVLERTRQQVSGRRFSLAEIRREHLDSMASRGLLRKIDLEKMSIADILSLADKHGIIIADNEDPRERMQELLTTRHMAMWHDHSDIAGKSHYLFMTWFIYDELVYLTDEEYRVNNNLTTSVGVQSVVETPFIYILARSTASVKDQLLYVPTRLEDIQELRETISLDDGTQYRDVLRFFSGDGPARQLEAGQQCGGKFPCTCGVEDFKFGDPSLFNSRGPFQSLQERFEHLNATETWSKGFQNGTVAVFEMLNKAQMEDELRARDAYDFTKSTTAAKVKQSLANTLRGVNRPPALYCAPEKDRIDCHLYEIAQTEPLHDFKSVINRVLKELPYATDDKDLKDLLVKIFSELHTANREMKGSESRLNLIKMAACLFSEHQESSDGQKMYQMLLPLIEMQKIAYSSEAKRSPKSILRCYNQSFLFASRCIELLKEPKHGTLRSLFGMPFHCLVVHLPEMLRLVSARSIVAEHAERHFNKLRELALRTTNRQANSVISGAMLRVTVERRKKHFTPNSFEIQDKKISKVLEKSSISIASDKLTLGCNTIINKSFFEENQASSLLHFKRIADYLELGPGVWYRVNGDYIEFLDGDGEPDSHVEGPQITHFRSHQLKDINERLDSSWSHCLKQKNSLQLPLLDACTLEESNTSTKAGVHKDMTLKVHPSVPAVIDEPIEKRPIVKSEPECSGAKTFVLSVPILAKEGDSDKQQEGEKSDHSNSADVLQEIWPYDKGVLDTYISVKEEFKKHQNMSTKLELREAGKNLRPYLCQLENTIKEKERQMALQQMGTRNFILVEGDPELLRQLKAVRSERKLIE